MELDKKAHSLKLEYVSGDKSFPDYKEEVMLQHMSYNDDFYIFETVNSVVLGKYTRVWIMQRLLHRPANLKVTYICQVNYNFHRSKNNCLDVIKSVGAMKNLILTLEPTEDGIEDKNTFSLISAPQFKGSVIGTSVANQWGFDDYTTPQVGLSTYTTQIGRNLSINAP